MKCFSCGIEKDLNALEIYPWAGEENCTITDEPIPPLFVLECQPDSADNGFRNDNGSPWKACVVCHACFHKLEPDMWISEGMWKGLNPVVPFGMLPENNVEIGKWDPESYMGL